MIVSGPLFRFGSILKFSHTFAQPPLFDVVDVNIHMQLRLHRKYHWSFSVTMVGSKDIHINSGAGDLNWKPKTVHTQASSSKDSSVRESAVTGNSMLSSGKHSISIEVGRSLFRYINGKGGSTHRRIERKTGTKILFPSSKEEESITIEGSSVDSITRASEEIQSIIHETVNSPSLTYSHFVSLPLAIHPELVGKLEEFRMNILGMAENDCNEVVDQKADLGIDESIFIKPRTFHLTVLMLKLWNKDRINTAVEVLRNVSSQVMAALDNRPVFVRLKGLDLMRGSQGKARVLYAPVEEVGNEGRLMSACKTITDAFVEAGLVLDRDANHGLKLHATVMNARHRKWKPGSTRMDCFDARGIFDRYGSEEWGEYLIPEAHLSQRFVFDGNGYYHCCASIPFLPSFHQ